MIALFAPYSFLNHGVNRKVNCKFTLQYITPVIHSYHFSFYISKFRLWLQHVLCGLVLLRRFEEKIDVYFNFIGEMHQRLNNGPQHGRGLIVARIKDYAKLDIGRD